MRMATASWDGTIGVWDVVPMPSSDGSGECTYALTIRRRLDLITGLHAPVTFSAAPAQPCANILGLHPSHSVVPFNVVIGMSSVPQLRPSDDDAIRDVLLCNNLLDPAEIPPDAGAASVLGSDASALSTYMAAPATADSTPSQPVSSQPVSSGTQPVARSGAPPRPAALVVAPGGDSPAPAPTTGSGTPTSAVVGGTSNGGAATTATAPAASKHRVWSVDIGADWVVAGGDGCEVMVWDAASCQLQHRLRGHTDSVYAVCLIGGGRAATGSADETVRIWDLVTGRCEAVLREHDDIVMCLACVADVLVTGSADATIRVCHVSAILSATHGDQRYGARAATSEFTLVGHSTSVYSVALDPLVPLLVSGSHGGEMRLWNVQTGRCVGLIKPFGVPTPHSNSLAVLRVYVVNDGVNRCIVACCRNGMVCSLDLKRQCAPAVSLGMGVGNARSVVVIGGTRLVTGSSDGSICIQRVKLGF